MFLQIKCPRLDTRTKNHNVDKQKWEKKKKKMHR